MKTHGFTLIEIVIIIVILGVIAAIGATMLEKSFDASFTNQGYIEANWQARLALERMARELLSARADGFVLNNTQITFKTENNVTVTYLLSGTTLTRNAKALVDGVTSLSFTYLDSNNDTTAIASEVRCILINATLNKNEVIVSPRTIVCPRHFS